MKILFVEDEIDLNNIVTKYLKKNGHSVDSVFDGEEALEYLEYGEYDLVILDVMMPKINGFEVVKELRNKGNNTSVLMLTARDSADDKVKGLDMGADEVKDLVLDTTEKSITRAGKKIDLTGKEYEILEYLVQSKNRILSRDQIIERVWGYEYEGDSNIIDVLIKNIRKKIDVGDEKQIIYTKRGMGYVVKEDDE